MPKSLSGTGSSVKKPSGKPMTPDERKKFIRDLVKRGNLKSKDLGGIVGTRKDDAEEEEQLLMTPRADKYLTPDDES